MFLPGHTCVVGYSLTIKAATPVKDGPQASGEVRVTILLSREGLDRWIEPGVESMERLNGHGDFLVPSIYRRFFAFLPSRQFPPE